MSPVRKNGNFKCEIHLFWCKLILQSPMKFLKRYFRNFYLHICFHITDFKIKKKQIQFFVSFKQWSTYFLTFFTLQQSHMKETFSPRVLSHAQQVRYSNRMNWLQKRNKWKTTNFELTYMKDFGKGLMAERQKIKAYFQPVNRKCELKEGNKTF